MLLVSRNRMFFGQIFLIYVSLYSVGRFWIEGLRTDSLMLTANLRIAQVLSIVLLIGSILTYIYLKNLRRKIYMEALLNFLPLLLLLICPISMMFMHKGHGHAGIIICMKKIIQNTLVPNMI